ncbi:MAG: hypothetical protein GC181_01775 [Bacteroidetes bacterium]|nr:hypothetical protein [Bacteroidota bacterium]
MKSKVLTTCGLLLIAIFCQSFTNAGGKSSDFMYELEVKIGGEDVESVVEEVYNQFEFCGEVMSYTVFERAVKGYLLLLHTGQLENDRYLSVIDFSLSSKLKRLWVLDMKSKTVLMNELVAHGKNTGDEYAKYFSNKIESQQSSLGFYVTGETYNGRHEYSLKLNGLENGFNTNAFCRGIVIHGANYVDQSIVDKGQRIGRSFGCPAVSEKVNKSLVDTIKDGTCLFIHYPDKRYLSRSKILNNSLYIPFEVLQRLKG